MTPRKCTFEVQVGYDHNTGGSLNELHIGSVLAWSTDTDSDGDVSPAGICEDEKTRQVYVAPARRIVMTD